MGTNELSAGCQLSKCLVGQDTAVAWVWQLGYGQGQVIYSGFDWDGPTYGSSIDHWQAWSDLIGKAVASSSFNHTGVFSLQAPGHAAIKHITFDDSTSASVPVQVYPRIRRESIIQSTDL